MKNITRISLALLIFATVGQAQVVTTDLPYITLDDSINLTFNAAMGNGNLNGVSPVYMHTGLIKSSSDYVGDWQNQVSLWGEADPTVQMNSIGGNQHTKGINITDFYGVGNWEDVSALVMVFRNADGSVVGSNSDGSDILIPVFETTANLDAVIMDPIRPGKIVDQNEPLEFNVRSNNSGSLISLYKDGTQVGQGIGNDVSANVSTATIGKFYLSYSVEAGGETVMDTTYYIVRPQVTVQDPPAGIEPGINVINSTTVTLCLWAPFKEFSYVVGDFSNWQVDPANLMNVSQDGERHWITINGLTPGQEYGFQYFVDGTHRVADPYSYKILEEHDNSGINPNIYPNLMPYPDDLTHNDVSIFQTEMETYDWDVTNFTSPAKEDLVIYELLLRDFSFRKNFKSVIDSLDYLHNLGVNAIQLMPIMEFEGNASWGYNPIYFMATDKKYGPSNELKEMVDSCHARGIAVILDIVPNHAFGRNPYVQLYWDAGLQRPAANSSYFNAVATHPFSVGYDFNHESPYVRTMWHRIFKYWIDEFHVDGYRLDLTKGLTQNNTGGDVGAWSQYDQSRVDILFDYANTIWSYAPNSHLIFEHLSDNAEETVIANGNVMLWSKATDQFAQASMGWPNDADWSWQTSYQTKGWNMPRAVGYMESHDEERLMFKNVTYGNGTNPDHMANDTATALFRMQGIGAMFFLVPGPKMIWQFGELGYDYSIFWPSGMEVTRIDPKPVRWNYFWEEPRQVLYKVWSALIELKHQQPVYSSTDYGLDLGGTGKRMWLSHPDMNVSVTYNSDVTGFDMTPDFQHTGTWYNYFTGDPLQVDQTDMTLYYAPGQYYVFTDQPLPIPDTSFVPFPENVDPDAIAEVSNNGLRVYPNPFNATTTIEFDLNGEKLLGIEVLDLMGRSVKSLNVAAARAGLNRFSWNGHKNNGTRVSNGQYLVRVVTEKRVISNRVVMNR